MKICKICKENKNLNEFSRQSKNKDGLRHNCKKCRSRSYFEKKDYYSNLAKQWKMNNIEYLKLCNRDYKKKNRKYYNSLEARRRATKLQATPLWLTEEQLNQIKSFYTNCPEGYEVDHIIPLKGKNVRGLHVPWNLQYLTKNENRSKSNRIIEENYVSMDY